MPTIRMRTKCGLVASFSYHTMKDGKWKLVSAGNFRRGRAPVPSDFAPFEISNAVVNGPRFDTRAECEQFIRGL